jgi:hypothetical protein
MSGVTALVKDVTKNIVDYCDTSTHVEWLKMTHEHHVTGAMNNIEQIQKIQLRLKDTIELLEQLKQIYVSSVVAEANGV